MGFCHMCPLLSVSHVAVAMGRPHTGLSECGSRCPPPRGAASTTTARGSSTRMVTPLPSSEPQAALGFQSRWPGPSHPSGASMALVPSTGGPGPAVSPVLGLKTSWASFQAPQRDSARPDPLPHPSWLCTLGHIHPCGSSPSTPLLGSASLPTPHKDQPISSPRGQSPPPWLRLLRQTWLPTPTPLRDQRPVTCLLRPWPVSRH